MAIRTAGLRLILLTATLVALAFPARALAQATPCTPSLPPNLSVEVSRAADAYLLSPGPAEGKLDTLAVLTALHALAMGPIKDVLFVPVETSDTSKQTGGSSRSGGAAALVEKPSFATLLALAVESGAVDADGSDTQLTLSSSLYALAAAINGDTATNYRRSGFFTRVGFAATFDAVANSPDPLANARRDQLREWGFKIRLSPDRSVRSRHFEQWWNKEIRPEMVKQIDAINLAKSLLDENTGYSQALDGATDALNSSLPEAEKQKDRAKVELLFTCELQTRIFEPIIAGRILVEPEILAELRNTIVPTLTTGGKALATVNTRVRQHIEDVASLPTASVAFRRFRPVEGRDFWETTFAYSQKLSPLTAFVSAGVSRYVAREGETQPLQGWRDVVVAASLEHSTRSPFVRNSPDLSRLTLALSAGYEKVFDHSSVVPTVIESTKTLFQARVELPLTLGVILPMSFSVSNDPALVEEDKKWNKGMFFGLTFDLDKFAALTKALSVVRPPSEIKK